MTETESAEKQGRPGALRQPAEIESMFDRIVGRYDTMNRIMTGGMDVRWRRAAARAAIGAGADRVLDLATGTGDLAIELANQGVPLVVGVDLAGDMLHAAGDKLSARGERRVRLARGNAMRLPFADETFDAVTVAFGLRNMPDYAGAISEMARIVLPGGRVVILEMTPLRRPVMNRLFGLYFEHVVPLVGGLISGDLDAYRYLPRSVNAFPPADMLAGIMRDCGLRNVRYQLFALGTVALHIGIKR